MKINALPLFNFKNWNLENKKILIKNWNKILVDQKINENEPIFLNFNYQKKYNIKTETANRLKKEKKIICLDIDCKKNPKIFNYLENIFKTWKNFYYEKSLSNEGFHCFFMIAAQEKKIEIDKYLIEYNNITKKSYKNNDLNLGFDIFTNNGCVNINNFQKFKNEFSFTKNTITFKKFIELIQFISQIFNINLYLEQSNSSFLKIWRHCKKQKWEKIVNKIEVIYSFLNGEDLNTFSFLQKNKTFLYFMYFQKEKLWEDTFKKYWKKYYPAWNLKRDYFQKQFKLFKEYIEVKNDKKIISKNHNIEIFHLNEASEKSNFIIFCNHKLILNGKEKIWSFADLLAYSVKLNEKNYSYSQATSALKTQLLYDSKKWNEDFEWFLFENGVYNNSTKQFISYKNLNFTICSSTYFENIYYEENIIWKKDENKKIWEWISTLLKIFKNNWMALDAFIFSIFSLKNPDNVAFWFYSKKGFGKSSFFKHLMKAFSNYKISSDFQDLKNESKKLQFYGKLIAFDDDASSITPFNSYAISGLKKETNGKELQIDVKFKNAINIYPTWTWICLANSPLWTRDLSLGDGTLDRIIHYEIDEKLFSKKWNWSVDWKKEEYKLLFEWLLKRFLMLKNINCRQIFENVNLITNNQKKFIYKNCGILRFLKECKKYPEYEYNNEKFVTISDSLIEELIDRYLRQMKYLSLPNYNKDDIEAALILHDWKEKLR